MKRRDFCKGLAVTLAAGTLAPGAALPQAGAATALVGRAVPDDYYYSDSLLDHPATEYDNQLALAMRASKPPMQLLCWAQKRPSLP